MVREYDHTVEPVLTVLLNMETDTVGEIGKGTRNLEMCYSLATYGM